MVVGNSSGWVHSVVNSWEKKESPNWVFDVDYSPRRDGDNAHNFSR